MIAKRLERASANVNDRISILGENCRLNGNIETASKVILCGNFEGTISCNTLETGVDSKVSAKIIVGDVVISGFFEGEILCHNVLTVARTGRVFGKVSYGILTVEPGGIIEGNTSKLESRDKKVLSIPESPSSS
jgi:cytoskeletal protein CcmA (bactofilin family)